MLKNYFMVGFRNLRKNKSYVIINTFGLGIALACCITAYLLLAYNIEFDDFHKDKKVENIYKVHAHFTNTDAELFQSISAPINLGPNAQMDIAGITRFTRYNRESGYVRSGDDSYRENVSFADSTFFDMFDFPLLHGSYQSFKEQHTVFLSEETAHKYFRDKNPIGKTLIFNFVNQTELKVIVGGVIKNVPVNSSFVFDLLIRMEHFYDIHNLTIDNWKDWRDPSTFLELASKDQATNVSTQLGKYIERRNKEKTDRTVKTYKLEHFKSVFDQDDIRWGQVNLRISPAPLVVFTSMAMMILLIACFNMTNTSIAMTAKRMKEVGIRKVVGAGKRQIVAQFLFETVIVILFSLITGLALSNILVPAFINMWELDYGMDDLNGLNLLITLLALVFFTSLLAGIYPALFNSKFKPVVLLKGNARIKGTNILTRGLISVQFALSVIVLIGGVIFIQNTKYQEKIKFGYDKDMVLLVNIQSEKEMEVMENEIRRNPDVLQVGTTSHSLGWSSYSVPVGIDTAEYEIRHYAVGKNYFEIMGLPLIDGRGLNLENTTDKEGAVVVNKAFLDKTGLQDPIRKVIRVHGVKRHIVGVVENHVDNLFRSREPEPALFYPGIPGEYQYMLVRSNPENLASVKSSVEDTWKKQFPDKPFQCHFQEDLLLGETRKTNANLEKIFLFLTILGGLLSGSGIFSLASLNIEKRGKEIGIRKALGASVENIVHLMNVEFMIILIVSGLLGSVGGYVLTGALLDEIYAYHINVGLVPVLICAFVIFAIGISTTTFTILKGARANPVDTLRDE